jgi:hypothetical protein
MNSSPRRFHFLASFYTAQGSMNEGEASLPRKDLSPCGSGMKVKRGLDAGGTSQNDETAPDAPVGK